MAEGYAANAVVRQFLAAVIADEDISDLQKAHICDKLALVRSTTPLPICDGVVEMLQRFVSSQAAHVARSESENVLASCCFNCVSPFLSFSNLPLFFLCCCRVSDQVDSRLTKGADEELQLLDLTATALSVLSAS